MLDAPSHKRDALQELSQQSEYAKRLNVFELESLHAYLTKYPEKNVAFQLNQLVDKHKAMSTED
eukprot:788445-Pyramimonas_sp.AAC.1